MYWETCLKAMIAQAFSSGSRSLSGTRQGHGTYAFRVHEGYSRLLSPIVFLAPVRCPGISQTMLSCANVILKHNRPIPRTYER
jgi:hypothetical protein